ncbi:MAG TPA: efflux RND transporter periplasmic adaptor subunit [Steroidobacteraceae bacterium]|jgi:RND family efflux transporter MFP subunit
MRSAIVLCLGTAVASVPAGVAHAGPDTPSVLVQTTPLRQGDLPRTVMAYGSVQADPSVHGAVVAPLAATISAIYVRVGQEVPRGAALVQLEPTPQTRAAYAQAQSALQAASTSLKRTQDLLSEQLATRQQVADAERALADARATLTALQAQGAAGPTILRAPHRAIVTALSANLNTIVTEGAALLDLARPDGLVLLAGVVPDQAASIAPGDKADVSEVDGNRHAAGRVLLRGSVVDPGDGLVPIHISLPPGALLPGQTAQAQVTTGSVHGYLLPHQSILVDDSGDPYVVQAVRGVAKFVHVRILGSEADQDVVDGPFDRTAPLVLAGNYQLQDGMTVRLAPAGGKNPGSPSR